ncbi:flagellar biosynthesis protein FlhB [Ruminococcaceae bacterium OttesenSCG-928-I18]|nr:flagellar biosynthesis protein FlhB [Ruminococcaceae bacterium OttesenSCG-928-I18]
MPGDEKTEQATPKRKNDERKKGNVFKSQEIVTLASLLAVFYTLQFVGNIILTALMGSVDRFWNQASVVQVLALGDVRKIFIQCAGVYAVAAVPCLIVAGLAVIAVTLAQTRMNFSTDALKPKFSRMSPKQGLKKIFSMRGVVELLKSILKITILGYVIYSKYLERVGELPRLMEMDFINVLYYGADFLMDVVTTVAIIFAFLAAGDFLFQRWQYEKDMRMSKQEVKEEYKQTEGDPQIKGKIKQKQREMSQARMMQSVPEADVVIRNPTHYAVAIKYAAGIDNAPIVLAKGADLMALRIIKLAEESNIMLVENKPLARSLYDNAPLDTEIPAEFYGAVAEVLAFVYSVKDKKLNIDPSSYRPEEPVEPPGGGEGKNHTDVPPS